MKKLRLLKEFRSEDHKLLAWTDFCLREIYTFLPKKPGEIISTDDLEHIRNICFMAIEKIEPAFYEEIEE